MSPTKNKIVTTLRCYMKIKLKVSVLHFISLHFVRLIVTIRTNDSNCAGGKPLAGSVASQSLREVRVFIAWPLSYCFRKVRTDDIYIIVILIRS